MGNPTLEVNFLDLDSPIDKVCLVYYNIISD